MMVDIMINCVTTVSFLYSRTDVELSSSLLGILLDDKVEELNMVARSGMWTEHQQDIPACKCKGRCKKNATVKIPQPNAEKLTASALIRSV